VSKDGYSVTTSWNDPEIEAERDAIVNEVAPQHPYADKIKALAELRSIGPEFPPSWSARCSTGRSTTDANSAALPEWRRAPIPAARISKAGSPMVRTTMIELAWLWLQYQPGSALSIWFRERVGDRKGRVRRIAIVAMARKLLVALWRCLETSVVPTGAKLKPR
jgi:transposase